MALNSFSGIEVLCKCKGIKPAFVSEKEVQFVNIEEDEQGRDQLTFICPRCGEEHTSMRFGIR